MIVMIAINLFGCMVQLVVFIICSVVFVVMILSVATVEKMVILDSDRWL